jgi:transcription initiation factor TFIID subunit 2
METRFYVLKICETLYKPKEEPLPKLKLRMPLPVTMPVDKPVNALPRIKLFAGGANKAKAQVPVPDQENLYLDTQVNGVPFPAPDGAPDQPLRLTLQSRQGPGKASQGRKVKKPRVMKSQAKGMSLDDVKACRSCLKKLMADKASEMFRFPVGEQTTPTLL